MSKNDSTLPKSLIVDETLHRESQDGRYLPDILDSIFALLDKDSLTKAARVCRAWHDLAVDYIWASLPNLLPLTTQFWQPYIHACQGQSSLDRARSQELLSRYYAYSQRVRSLKIGVDYQSADLRSFKSAIEEDASSEIQLTLLLPSLRDLRWTFSPNIPHDIQHFLPPTVKSLDIRFRVGVSISNITDILQIVRGACQEMTSFRLDISARSFLRAKERRLGDTLAEFIRSKLCLESLQLPYSMVPLRLFNGLEPLPRLREFHCMLCPEEFSGIPEFLEELTRACPNLQHLVIYARVQVFFTEPESFTLQAISPLFACHSLIELQIFHTRAFKLNSEQIRTIGHSLPLLETLALCPNVLFPEAGQTAMHLSQLTNFGPTWFPSLKRLAVCVETLHPPTPSRSKDVFQVEAFCVGSTKVDPNSCKEVAEYLASMCSPHVILCNKSRSPGPRRYRDLVFAGNEGSYNLTGNWTSIEAMMRRSMNGMMTT